MIRRLVSSTVGLALLGFMARANAASALAVTADGGDVVAQKDDDKGAGAAAISPRRHGPTSRPRSRWFLGSRSRGGGGRAFRNRLLRRTDDSGASASGVDSHP